MDPHPSASSFIVGIGIGEGGSQDLKDLFRFFPEDAPSITFVVVSADPHAAYAEEGLSHFAPYPITVIRDHDPIEARRIYLCPLNKKLAFKEGAFVLLDFNPDDPFLLDDFFHSLALNYQDKAIGILLSSSPSDGAQGALALAEAGGLAIASEGPARDKVCHGVGQLLAPLDMGPFLSRYCLGSPKQETKPLPPSLTALIYERAGIDLSHYHAKRIMRSITRRQHITFKDSLTAYQQHLRDHNQELQALVQDLLIGVTAFFRDPLAFQYLESKLIPQIFQLCAKEQKIRIWVAGCASGQEAYSVGMLFLEYAQKIKQSYEIKIFASDVNPLQIKKAYQGLYTASEVKGVSAMRLRRFFQKRGDHYQVGADLRHMMTFVEHNVLTTPPFTAIDLLLCRNLLIYLTPKSQTLALSLFHYALTPKGYLFLGPSEGVLSRSQHFFEEKGEFRIYQKAPFTEPPPIPLMAWPPPATAPIPKAKELPAEMVQVLEPLIGSGLVIGRRDEVLQVLGRGEELLEVQSGQFSHSLDQCLHPSLTQLITRGLHTVEQEKKPLFLGDIPHPRNKDDTFAIKWFPLKAKDSDEIEFFVLQCFFPQEEAVLPLTYRPASSPKELDLEEQLSSARAQWLQAKEKASAMKEELTATNEELLASNEELHSVNEELYTVNSDYQKKIEELSQLEDDIDNLLRSTPIGTIFLDHNLHIRKITPAITKNFGIVAQDIGRSIEDFQFKFHQAHLAAMIREVTDTGVGRATAPLPFKDAWYVLRILPYLTRQKTSGAVLTLIDVSHLKDMELQLFSKDLQLNLK